MLILTTFDLDGYVRGDPARRQRLPVRGRPAEDLLTAVRVIAAGEGLLAWA